MFYINNRSNKLCVIWTGCRLVVMNYRQALQFLPALLSLSVCFGSFLDFHPPQLHSHRPLQPQKEIWFKVIRSDRKPLYTNTQFLNSSQRKGLVEHVVQGQMKMKSQLFFSGVKRDQNKTKSYKWMQKLPRLIKHSSMKYWCHVNNLNMITSSEKSSGDFWPCASFVWVHLVAFTHATDSLKWIVLNCIH